MGYVDKRDQCQVVAEGNVDHFLNAKEQSTDPKSRNTVLLAIFSRCMQMAGWGVSSPKMNAVYEKYGEERFAALFPQKRVKGKGSKTELAQKQRVAPVKESGLDAQPKSKRFYTYAGRGGDANARKIATPYWQESPPPGVQPPPAPTPPDASVFKGGGVGVGPQVKNSVYQPRS